MYINTKTWFIEWKNRTGFREKLGFSLDNLGFSFDNPNFSPYFENLGFSNWKSWNFKMFIDLKTRFSKFGEKLGFSNEKPSFSPNLENLVFSISINQVWFRLILKTWFFTSINQFFFHFKNPRFSNECWETWIIDLKCRFFTR